MDEVIVETEGALGRIRLNRPKALNALNHTMVGLIDKALDRFASDPVIAAVVLTGEGERALCAGGDLRSLYEDGTAVAADFWRDEYRLDARISHYGKPFVAVMDGITMGGGVGLSGHAAHRIVTERSRVAMPETGIGYLPDVGGTWLLPRAPGELGTYLGLTGAQIGAADAILCGMADVFLPSGSLPDLFAALASGEEVEAVLARFAKDPGPAPLEAHRAVIDRCFAFDMMDEIVSALDADGSVFAAETKKVLLTKAPSSLVLTLCMLRLGRAAPTLEACLEREFHASLAVLEEGDFREGIRAVVIDKDKSPRWNPPRLDQVDPARIARWLETRAEPVFSKDRTGAV